MLVVVLLHTERDRSRQAEEKVSPAHGKEKSRLSGAVDS